MREETDDTTNIAWKNNFTNTRTPIENKTNPKSIFHHTISFISNQRKWFLINKLIVVVDSLILIVIEFNSVN